MIKDQQNHANIAFNYKIITGSTNVLSGKPIVKRPLGRPRRRWEDNFGMDFEEIDINTGNWVDSAQDTDYWKVLVNAGFISYEVSQLVSQQRIKRSCVNKRWLLHKEIKMEFAMAK